MATSSSSSSAKKVAKLAQRGKGKKVRFQGGTLFPAAIVGVLVLGLLVIVYARESRPDPGSFPPQVGDHWHAALGVYACDTWLPKIVGEQAETFVDSLGNESLINDVYAATGVHSHDDGVIHYHPFSTRSVGERARLGVYLDVYDIELSEDRLELPEEQGGEVYDVDDYRCNGEEVEIKVVKWDSFADTGAGVNYITDLPDVRITNDGMVFVIAIVPVGTEVDMPPWAIDLPELGAVDGGNVPTPSTVPGDTTDTTDPATTEPATTEPATSTEPATTTGG